jgi:hypothetical protein
MYNLFLDDCRHPSEVDWVKLPDVRWIIARTYEDFVRIIERDGLPEIVSFDHDLGPSAYSQVVSAMMTGEIDYSKITEKTGYDAARFLVNYCLERNAALPEYYIHTLNPVGKLNILSVLQSYEKFYNGR